MISTCMYEAEKKRRLLKTQYPNKKLHVKEWKNEYTRTQTSIYTCTGQQ
jgi:hypothetical protein